MRLSLCLLLVVLAVSCYEANAGKVCKAVVFESLTFILRSRDALEKLYRTYPVSEEVIQAKLKVKDCVDKMKYGDRLTVAAVLAQILIECGVKGWVEEHFPGIPLGN
ncbi:prostatic steroid-binding protein C1-like [Grammomys surdaster]|uniref:prostatic steroid-binding protein C1-like n=1 Tax=Grammomys surdaster TaxID=491861 RepID=UPI00109FA9B1|nr:prostatic steroid-binding protein C1-like [Grammomys surdaster]